LATLLLSQGVPMICGGDEIGRTQRGNNNAYCQDNELSWYDWKLDRSSRELFAFVQQLIALRREHPVLRRRRFFQGRRIWGSQVKDLAWFRPDGKEMTDEDWNKGYVRCLGLRLAGDAIEEKDEKGRRIIGDTILILLNAHHESLPFTMPAHKRGVRWEFLLETAVQTVPEEPKSILFRKGGDRIDLAARSLAVFRLRGQEKKHTGMRTVSHASDAMDITHSKDG
jgi:isoamylase